MNKCFATQNIQYIVCQNSQSHNMVLSVYKGLISQITCLQNFFYVLKTAHNLKKVLKTYFLNCAYNLFIIMFALHAGHLIGSIQNPVTVYIKCHHLCASFKRVYNICMNIQFFYLHRNKSKLLTPLTFFQKGNYYEIIYAAFFHDTTCNEKTFLQDFLVILKRPHCDVIGRLKYSTTHMCVTRCERANRKDFVLRDRMGC